MARQINCDCDPGCECAADASTRAAQKYTKEDEWYAAGEYRRDVEMEERR